MYKIEQLSKPELIKVFMKFLEKNDAKEAFIKNYNEIAIHNFNLTEYINYSEPYQLIHNAFIWSSTEEDDFFWRDLNDNYIATFWNIDEKVS